MRRVPTGCDFLPDGIDLKAVMGAWFERITVIVKRFELKCKG